MGEAHRQTLHGGHFPDDEMAGQIDRQGRWWASAGATLLIGGTASLHIGGSRSR
ncbi:hypothetical protein [Streptomyces microflavus]|uniref:Uncharacterized protein n=1 Tax=Streptomyces microflavus TaxID=1919 RepID=A0ABV1QCN8_STRMI